MPIPEKVVSYHEKDLLDKVIEQVVTSDDPLNTSNLNKVAVAAQVQLGIDSYRLAAKGMSIDQILSESHDSKLLGLHLEQAFGARPSRCHAHALIAGKHHNAARLRVIMAALKIRIDDADNGCWLPENTAATPHPAFPAAPPHSRIHRSNYYFWLLARLGGIRTPDLFRANLKTIANLLQQGKMPAYVMLSKGIGLP